MIYEEKENSWTQYLCLSCVCQTQISVCHVQQEGGNENIANGNKVSFHDNESIGTYKASPR